MNTASYAARNICQIKIMPKFILHQSAKFSTRQYFRLYGMVNYLSQLDILLIALYETILENNIGG